MAKKWKPYAVIPVRDKDSTLKALRKNKPQFQWRTKKSSGMAGMFSYIRIEKR
jgi:hypothetical protein